MLVNQRFAATRCPGLSVTVAKNNEIVYSTALGLADVEQAVPLSTNSVHRLASVSKPITGTIIMDLVSQGKLSLDAPIRKYLPELPDTYSAITLRQLLDHQSGIIHESESVFFDMTHYATARAALKVFVDVPLSFKPGSATEYSSQGVTVAGAVAESVTGRSFQQLSADFFAAHGIAGFFLDDNFAIIPNRVRGYLVDRDSKITFQDGTASAREYLAGTPGAVTNARPYDISSRYPAGGFDSSGDDLLKFVIAVGTGKVLSPDRVREMWTAQTTDDGKRGVFGIGWGVSQREGQLVVGMNGATPSTTTSLLYFPESGVGVALLCNAEGAQGLSTLLDDIVSATFR